MGRRRPGRGAARSGSFRPGPPARSARARGASVLWAQAHRHPIIRIRSSTDIALSGSFLLLQNLGDALKRSRGLRFIFLAMLARQNGDDAITYGISKGMGLGKVTFCFPAVPSTRHATI